MYGSCRTAMYENPVAGFNSFYGFVSRYILFILHYVLCNFTIVKNIIIAGVKNKTIATPNW